MKNKSLKLTLAVEAGRDSALALSAPRSAAQREPSMSTGSPRFRPLLRGRGRRKRSVDQRNPTHHLPFRPVCNPMGTC